MPHTRAPRGRHAGKPKPQIDELLPARVRVQAFAYNPLTKQYHALSAYKSKTIVRNVRELERLHALLDAVVRNTAAWQD